MITATPFFSAHNTGANLRETAKRLEPMVFFRKSITYFSQIKPQQFTVKIERLVIRHLYFSYPRSAYFGFDVDCTFEKALPFLN
jgi:hypothetical protein